MDIEAARADLIRALNTTRNGSPARAAVAVPIDRGIEAF